MYTLSVACFPDAVLIGAIQGPKGANAMDLVRAATKALHGIRPHFFLIEVVRALCRKSGTQRLLGTDCRFRLKPSGFWKRQRGVRFDYRGFWVDIGGHLSDGQQWLIPLTGVCKPLEQVESKKRAMYRRRYELLDCLERDIRLVLSVSESAVRPTWATQMALDPGAA